MTPPTAPSEPHAALGGNNPNLFTRFANNWNLRRRLFNRRRSMNRTVASIERSPAVVALEGPFDHDNVYVRGIRLHLAVAGSPADPLILLIHGAFGGWYDYREVIEPLAALGFHVAAVDMRGYGMSDKPPSGYDLRHAAGDINGVIAALGHDNAVLVGHDSGGSVAWTASTMYPERVRAVISIGAIHPIDLRRAIARKPYLFASDITRIMLFKLPIPFLKIIRFIVPRAARQEVVQNTTPSYQRSSAFSETIRLRQKALSIDHTFAPIVRNNRLLIGGAPAKMHRLTTTVPVWILKQHTRRWDHLVSTARSRTTGPLRVISIPGATNLPFLEHPREFATLLAGFAETTEAGSQRG